MADFKYKYLALFLGLSISLVPIKALPYGGVKGVYQSPKNDLIAEDEATIKDKAHETIPGEGDVFDISQPPTTDEVSPPHPHDNPDISDSGSGYPDPGSRVEPYIPDDNTGPDYDIKDPDSVEPPGGDKTYVDDPDWVEPPGGDDTYVDDQDWVEPPSGDDTYDDDLDRVEPPGGDNTYVDDPDWVEPPGGDDTYVDDPDWVEPQGGDETYVDDPDWVEPPGWDDTYVDDQDWVEPPGGDNTNVDDQDWIEPPGGDDTNVDDQDWVEPPGGANNYDNQYDQNVGYTDDTKDQKDDDDDIIDLDNEIEDPEWVEPLGGKDNTDDGYDQDTTNGDHNDGHDDGTDQVYNSEEDKSSSWFTKLSEKWSDLKDTGKDLLTSVGKTFEDIDTSGVKEDFYNLWGHFKELVLSLGVEVERGAACVFQKISRTFDENNSYQILTKLELLLKDGDQSVKQFFETVGQKATSWVQDHNQGVDEEEFFEDQIGDSDFNDEIFQDQEVRSQLDRMVTDGILSQDEVSQLTQQSSSKIPLGEQNLTDSKENEIDSTGYGSFETTGKDSEIQSTGYVSSETTDNDFGVQSTGYGSSENTAKESGNAISFLPHREDFKGLQYQPKTPISKDQEYQYQSNGQY